MKHLFNLLILTLILSTCSSTKDSLFTQDDSLDELQSMMIGSYDSADQASEDSGYYDITLHMYPIWANDMSARWLYVEQSVTDTPDDPYRQRVYKLKTNSDGTFSSYVYTLDNPEEYIGKWNDTSYFDSKSRSILSLREGCEVVLEKKSGKYIGATRDKACSSTLKGASYANSSVTITKNEVKSWDQGFDINGQQVWGAQKGPYIFKRK